MWSEGTAHARVQRWERARSGRGGVDYKESSSATKGRYYGSIDSIEFTVWLLSEARVWIGKGWTATGMSFGSQAGGREPLREEERR